jgi:hypothetical protein
VAEAVGDDALFLRGRELLRVLDNLTSFLHDSVKVLRFEADIVFQAVAVTYVGVGNVFSQVPNLFRLSFSARNYCIMWIQNTANKVQ